MIWVVFGKGKVVDLVQVKSKMDKKIYNGILVHYAASFGTRNTGRGFTFKQDNDKMRSKKLSKL